MLRNVFLATLRERRRGLIGWSIGVAAFAAYGIAFWPTIMAQAENLNRLVEDLPEAIRALAGGETIDYGTPEGYLGSQVFSLTIPVMFLIFAIGFGARTIAGEERAGTLDLLLSTPLPRWRIVAEKLGGMIVATLLVGTALWAALTLGSLATGMGIGAGRLAAAVLMVVLLALTFGTLALAVGCATGRRSVAVATATAVAFAAYMLEALAPAVDMLDAIRGASPFFHYGGATTIREGIDPLNAAFLLFLSLVFGAIALVAFDRRDVGV
jgi:ABC-2 type transport system permease protein